MTDTGPQPGARPAGSPPTDDHSTAAPTRACSFEPAPMVWIDEVSLAASVTARQHDRRVACRERILAATEHVRVVELVTSRSGREEFPPAAENGANGERPLAVVEDVCAALASRRTIEAVDVLRQRAGNGQPSAGSARSHYQRSAGHLLAGYLNDNDRADVDAIYPRVRAVRVLGRVEGRLQRIRAAMVLAPAVSWNRLCRVWAPVSVLATITAVGLMLAGHVTIAAVTFTARVTCSALLPPPYPIANRRRRRVSWKLCVLGHLTDALGLLGIAAYLSAHNRVVYATVMSAAAMFMLSATLFRVAALQTADFVRRLVAERLVRNGSLLIGVWAAAAFQPDLSPRVVPLAAVAGIGPVLYAGAEVGRVLWRDRVNRRRRSELDAEQRQLDRHLEVDRVLRDPAPLPMSPARVPRVRVRRINASATSQRLRRFHFRQHAS